MLDEAVRHNNGEITDEILSEISFLEQIIYGKQSTKQLISLFMVKLI